MIAEDKVAKILIFGQHHFVRLGYSQNLRVYSRRIVAADPTKFMARRF